MKKIIWIFCMLVFTATYADAHWIVQASGFATPSRGIRFIHAVSGTVVWASAYDGSVGPAPCQDITMTSNGGTTWSLVTGTSIPDPVSGEYGVIGYYSSVGNTIWFGTNKGRIYKSVDNGHNWTVSSISGWSTKYVCPVFRDAMNGLVQDRTSTTTGALVRTTDGGTTWTPVTTTGNVFYEDLAYVPGSAATWVSTGATSGYDGVTYSFNDGVSWNDMAGTIGDQYLATAWVNNSTAWAGGFNTNATSGGMYKFNSVLTEPVASFSGNPTNIGVGGQVQFTDLSSGAPTNWQWSFPGGNPSSSSAQTPSPVTYNTPGQYSVTLTITTYWGNDSEMKTNYITVAAAIAPVSDFTANQTNILTNGQVQFTDLSSSTPTSWQWSFPGGTPSSSTQQTPPPITYSNVGQYDVSLTVTNAGGSGSNTKSQYITVTMPAAPVANFMADHTNIAMGGHVEFYDLSTGNPVTWHWNFPGGNPTESYLQNPSPIVYYSPGQYDVTLTVTNLGGSGTNTKGKYIYVGNIGIGEPGLANPVLYPNPAGDYIRVRSGETIRELAILDRLGVTVLKTNPGSREFEIRLEDIPAGLYFVQMTGEEGVVTRKIVISR